MSSCTRNNDCRRMQAALLTSGVSCSFCVYAEGGSCSNTVRSSSAGVFDGTDEEDGERLCDSVLLRLTNRRLLLGKKNSHTFRTPNANLASFQSGTSESALDIRYVRIDSAKRLLGYRHAHSPVGDLCIALEPRVSAIYDVVVVFQRPTNPALSEPGLAVSVATLAEGIPNQRTGGFSATLPVYCVRTRSMKNTHNSVDIASCRTSTALNMQY